MELIDRIKAILRDPQLEWAVIAREPDEPRDLLVHYVAILALIPPLAHFAGSSLVRSSTPVGAGLLGAVLGYGLNFVEVFVLALVIDLLAPSFYGHRNFPAAFKLSVYAHTPYWLAGIFLLIPPLSLLTFLGLYGFYLLWIGLPLLMRVPEDQGLLCAASVMAVALLLALAFSALPLILFAPRS